MIQHVELGAACSECQNPRTRRITIPPSPVPNLIYTNLIPSPSETHLINNVLSQLQPDLLQIDRDVNRIQSWLDQLLRTREELREFGRVHKALLSSIRQFPHELLSHTFLLSVPDMNQTSAQELKRAVMLPAQVCKRWRDVALSTPRLWSRIHMDLRKRRLEEEAAFAQRWLARSGGCPLSISLSQFMTFDMTIPVASFDAFVAQSDRWEHLNLTVSYPLLHVFRSAKSRFSRLQTLSIESNTLGEGILDAFEIAPHLHSLTIGHNIFPSMLRVPWSQLTYCDMHPYQLSIDDCFEVLQHASNLEEYHLHLHRPGPHQSRPLIRHERLRELSIQACTQLGPLFDKLTLPALQAFSCSAYEYRYRWAQPQFLSLLSRSACALQVFCLDFLSAQLIDDDLAQILQLVPSLNKLALRHECARKSLTRTLLGRLTPVPQELACLLPNLTTFALDVYFELDGEAFADMIESRRRLETDTSYNVPLLGIVALTDHTNRSSNWIDSPTVLRLKRCRDEGLDIYWSRREDCKELRLPL